MACIQRALATKLTRGFVRFACEKLNNVTHLILSILTPRHRRLLIFPAIFIAVTCAKAKNALEKEKHHLFLFDGWLYKLGAFPLRNNPQKACNISLKLPY